MKATPHSVPLLVATLVAASAIVASACGLSSVGIGSNLTDEGGVGPGDQSDTGGGNDADGGKTIEGGSIGGDGGTDASFDSGPPDPYLGRVTNGLVALYDFEEGKGSTVNDSIAPSYPINIGTMGDITWHPHSLELTNFTHVASGNNFDKLVAACKVTNEVTVEAWMKYADVEGDDTIYGRLLTVAGTGSTRDVALGNVGKKQWWFSMDQGDDVQVDGWDALLHHQVLVRTSDNNQTVRGYLDGAEIGNKTGTADPKSFTSFPLTVGNSPGGGRGVKGTIHLIAFYGRALTPAEITTNFKAGPDPK